MFSGTGAGAVAVQRDYKRMDFNAFANNPGAVDGKPIETVIAVNSVANIAGIRQQLAARHIRVVDATGLIISAAKAGLLQGDRLHLTAEGNRRVAAGLLASVR